MYITEILSQVLGIIITVFGLSVLVNKKSVIALTDDTSKSYGIVWILGFITLIMGVVVVVLNNLWTTGLELLITIIGWLTLVKGILTLVFPDFTVSMYKKWVKRRVIVLSGVAAFVLGLVLLYFGFSIYS